MCKKEGQIKRTNIGLLLPKNTGKINQKNNEVDYLVEGGDRSDSRGRDFSEHNVFCIVLTLGGMLMFYIFKKKIKARWEGK